MKWVADIHFGLSEVSLSWFNRRGGGGGLLFQIFSFAISVRPRVCFYLRFDFDFYVSKLMHLTTKCLRNQSRTKGEGWSTTN